MIQGNLFSQYGEYHLTPDDTPDPFKRISDLQRAKDYMKQWPGRWFTPEQVQREIHLSIGVPALARKMRLYRKQGLLESRLREGKYYKEYKWLTLKSEIR